MNMLFNTVSETAVPEASTSLAYIPEVEIVDSLVSPLNLNTSRVDNLLVNLKTKTPQPEDWRKLPTDILPVLALDGGVEPLLVPLRVYINVWKSSTSYPSGPENLKMLPLTLPLLGK
jgi:hypothetical protein